MPNAPTGLTVTQTDSTDATLQWAANTDSVIGYNIYHSDNGGAFQPFALPGGVPFVGTSYPLTVLAGRFYVYYITAVDPSHVESGHSASVLLDLRGQPADNAFSAYLTVSQANDLAVAVQGLPSWNAATDAAKLAALVLATMDVDRGMRFQGRKYDLTQALEFPRLPYGVQISSQYCQPFGQSVGSAMPGDVWDWDQVNLVAIVPQTVKVAVLYQADYSLSGKRDALLDRIQLGLTSSRTGDLAETYDLAIANEIASQTLCVRSRQFLDRYRIKQGRML